MAALLTVWFVIFREGFFRIDDYLYLANARRAGGWSWAWLGSVWWKHFAPGDRAVWVLVGHATPSSWGALLGFQLAMFATGLLALYGSLRRLFGPAGWLLAAVALVGSSSQFAVAFAWPSHGLMALPEFAAQTVTLYAFLSYVETRRRRYLLLCAGALTFGLLFYVRTLLVVVVIAVVRLLWLESSLRPAALARAAWRDRMAWAALLVPALAYLVYYEAADVFGAATPYSSRALEQYVRILWLRNVWPRMLGIQLGDRPLSTLGVLGEMLAQTLLWVAVAASLWRKRAAWRAWALIPAVLVPTIWMSATGRLAELGPQMGVDVRYSTHLPWVIALVVLYAFHPRRRLSLGAPWPHAARTAPLRAPRVAPGVAVAGVVLAIAVAGLRKDASVRSFDGAGARAFVGRLTATARTLTADPAGARLTDGPAPAVVAGKAPITMTEIVLATGAPVEVSLAEVPSVSLAPDGRLLRGSYLHVRDVPLGRRAAHDALTRAGRWRRAPGGWCLRPAGTGSASLTVPLRSPTPPGEAFIDADVLERADDLPVALDTGAGLPDATQASLWSPGPRRVGVATGVNGLKGFRIDVPAGQQLCASRLSVGVFRAAAG